jgi:phosphotransferase family enzyme
MRPTRAETIVDDMMEHPSARFWSQLRPERTVPERIDILKCKPKSTVCRLFGVGPGGAAVIAKRCRTPTGAVERMIYQEILPGLELPSPRIHGFVEESDGANCWLFLEDSGGMEYAPGNPEHRALAGRWLGAIHALRIDDALLSRLPDRGADHYLGLLHSSRSTLAHHISNPLLPVKDRSLLRSILSHCDVVESHWSEVEALCRAIPPVLVHGDLVVKNVSVRDGPGDGSLMVFDWENAGWGMPGTDLCQCPGKTVSPDLDVYSAVTEGSARPVDPQCARRLAEYGAVFRVLDDIRWAVMSMVFDSYRFLSKPIAYLRSFEPLMAHAVRTAGWRGWPELRRCAR